MQEQQTLTLTYDDELRQTLLVTLNRPDVLNALDTRMMDELRTVFREQAQDDALRCVILTGAGERAFCAGADLKERDGMTTADWRKQHRILEEMFLALRAFPTPVIAAVEGYALAGGCELALLADFILAGETARFGLTEVTRGILPGGGGLQNLARAIGMRRAKELIFAGEHLDAQRAYEWGLVNRMVPAGQALVAAREVAARIRRSAPLAVRAAKRALTTGADADFATAYALDLAEYNALLDTEDRREGIAAFNEKRPPAWKGR